MENLAIRLAPVVSQLISISRDEACPTHEREEAFAVAKRLKDDILLVLRRRSDELSSGYQDALEEVSAVASALETVAQDAVLRPEAIARAARLADSIETVLQP